MQQLCDLGEKVAVVRGGASNHLPEDARPANIAIIPGRIDSESTTAEQQAGFPEDTRALQGIGSTHVTGYQRILIAMINPSGLSFFPNLKQEQEKIMHEGCCNPGRSIAQPPHLMSITAARTTSPSSQDSISSTLGSKSPLALKREAPESPPLVGDVVARWARQPAALSRRGGLSLIHI